MLVGGRGFGLRGLGAKSFGAQGLRFQGEWGCLTMTGRSRGPVSGDCSTFPGT